MIALIASPQSTCISDVTCIAVRRTPAYNASTSVTHVSPHFGSSVTGNYWERYTTEVSYDTRVIFASEVIEGSAHAMRP
jgi:hypothetical protein